LVGKPANCKTLDEAFDSLPKKNRPRPFVPQNTKISRGARRPIALDTIQAGGPWPSNGPHSPVPLKPQRCHDSLPLVGGRGWDGPSKIAFTPKPQRPQPPPSVYFGPIRRPANNLLVTRVGFRYCHGPSAKGKPLIRPHRSNWAGHYLQKLKGRPSGPGSSNPKSGNPKIPQIATWVVFQKFKAGLQKNPTKKLAHRNQAHSSPLRPKMTGQIRWRNFEGRP